MCIRDRRGIGGASAIGRRDDEIFLRGEIGKDLASLRHQPDTELGDAVSRQCADLLAAKSDRSGRSLRHQKYSCLLYTSRRQRYGAAQHRNALFEAAAVVQRGAEIGPGAVSYTHLDVYKRQI